MPKQMLGFENGIGVQRSGEYRSVLNRLINNDNYEMGVAIVSPRGSSSDGSDGLSNVPRLSGPTFGSGQFLKLNEKQRYK